MLPSFIKSGIKTLVLFDMDGVLAEYKWGENEAIKRGDVEVYLSKRPIKSVIKFAKKLFDEGVAVGILSSCETAEQREAKLVWLSANTPFIKGNVHIVVWNELGLVGSDRDSAKARVMQGIRGYDEIYLIDDKHKIINATNEILPNCARHVSEVLE